MWEKIKEWGLGLFNNLSLTQVLIAIFVVCLLSATATQCLGADATLSATVAGYLVREGY